MTRATKCKAARKPARLGSSNGWRVSWASSSWAARSISTRFCERVPEDLRAEVRERCIDVLFVRRAMPHQGDSIRSQEVGGGTDLGDFRLLRRIGEGAMGVVYLARQRSLDRLVAVKVLRATQARSERSSSVSGAKRNRRPSCSTAASFRFTRWARAAACTTW
jgi:hypothetical protein